MLIRLFFVCLSVFQGATGQQGSVGDKGVAGRKVGFKKAMQLYLFVCLFVFHFLALIGFVAEEMRKADK